MLWVHRSNHLEQLAEALIEVLLGGQGSGEGPERLHFFNPLSPPPIAVQGRGMERWLSLRLAERLGAFVGGTFPFPEALLAELCATRPRIADEAPGTRQGHALAGLLLDLLLEVTASGALAVDAAVSSSQAHGAPRHAGANVPDEAVPEALRRVLGSSDDASLRAVNLAFELSELFAFYLRYRSDWLDAFEAAQLPDELDTPAAREHGAWQAWLWRALRARLADGSAIVNLRTWTRAEHLLAAQAEVPALAAAARGEPTARLHRARAAGEPLLLFGFASLPPFFLQVLEAEATLRPVHLFVLAPTQAYVADLKPRAQTLSESERLAFARLAAGLLPEALAAAGGHAAADLIVGETEVGPDDAPHPRQALDPLALLADDDIPEVLLYAGTLGRHFQGLLEELTYQQEDHFTEPSAPHLLGALQRSLFEASVSLHAPCAAYADDGSVEIHGCGGPLREVEALFDRLAARFAADETLTPEDVLVLVPSLDAYTAAIASTFALIDDAPVAGHLDAAGSSATRVAALPAARHSTLPASLPATLPATLADRSRLYSDPAQVFCRRLFALLTEAATPEAFLDLLLLPGLSEPYALSGTEAEGLFDLLEAAGVRIGLDASQRAASLGVTRTEGTLLATLDRLILGWMAPGARLGWERPDPYTGDPFAADAFTQAFDAVEGESAAWVLRLAHAHADVRALSDGGPRPLAQWCADWAALLRAWLLPTAARERLLRALAAAQADASEAPLGGLGQGVAGTEPGSAPVGAPGSATSGPSPAPGQPISLAAFRAWFEHIFGNERDLGGLLRGGITFCEPVPMRSLPFRIVACLGLGEGAFPRAGQRPAYDLAAAKPRAGDRSARLEDQHVFLESILSARDAFWVFYTAKDPSTAQPQNPSPLTVALDQTLRQITGFGVAPQAAPPQARATTPPPWEVVHPLQPTALAYATGAAWTFSQAHATLAHAFHGPAASAAPPPEAGAASTPSAQERRRTLDLEALQRSVLAPWRTTLRYVHGAASAPRLGRSTLDESALAKGLARYKLREALLEALVTDSAIERALFELRSAGELPPGALGRWHVTAALQQCRALLECVRAERFSQPEWHTLDLAHWQPPQGVTTAIDAPASQKGQDFAEGSSVAHPGAGRLRLWRRDGKHCQLIFAFRSKAGPNACLRAAVHHAWAQAALGEPIETWVVSLKDSGETSLTCIADVPDLGVFWALDAAASTGDALFIPDISLKFASDRAKGTGDIDALERAQPSDAGARTPGPLDDPDLHLLYGTRPWVEDLRRILDDPADWANFDHWITALATPLAATFGTHATR